MTAPAPPTGSFVHRFPAMGGSVELQLSRGGFHAATRVETLFAGYERALSRFLPDSELCALNASSGKPFAASSLVFDIIENAMMWAERTGGVFDPTVIDVLEATGYDRTFEDGCAREPVRGAAREPGGWHDIVLDHEHRTITLPAGLRLDLGGIGKGYTVDRAIDLLGRDSNALVNASGDMYAAGHGPEGEGWLVGVQDPFEVEEDIAVLAVHDRGVATSGSSGRHWTVGERLYHHLIDVRTSDSAESDVLTATVAAPSATAADVLAKTAFVLGVVAGRRFIEEYKGAECLLVTRRGGLVETSGMREYLR